MKRKNKTAFTLFIIVICFAGSLYANDYDFRKTKWGMSVADVKNSESIKPIEEKKNFLFYKTYLLNKDMKLSYFFVDDKLIDAMYLLNERHMNSNDYILDYYAFKEILTKKYGESKIQEKIWKNNLYKDDDNPDWGLLISIGHLVYTSFWETDTTQIYLSLHGDNFEIDCGIAYRSNKLKELRDKNEEKRALESF